MPEPQENFLSWDEVPSENKGGNRRGKEGLSFCLHWN